MHASQPGWIPAQRIQRELVGYIMGWHLPPPFGPSEILLISFQGPHRVSYRDLLLGDDSGKWLSFCLAKVGSFGQWFPKILTSSSLAVPPTFQAWTSLMAFAQIVPSAQNGLQGSLSCFVLYSQPPKQCPAHSKSSKNIWCVSEYFCMSEYLCIENHSGRTYPLNVGGGCP